MIEITSYPGVICLKGHAGYAEPGKDIVCAAVSVLVANLINSLVILAADEFEYASKVNETTIEFKELSDKGQLLLDSFFVGINCIVSEYPDFVTLSSGRG